MKSSIYIIVLLNMITLNTVIVSAAKVQTNQSTGAHAAAIAKTQLTAEQTNAHFEMDKMNAELIAIAKSQVDSQQSFSDETPIPFDQPSPKGYKSIPCCKPKHSQWGAHKHFVSINN